MRLVVLLARTMARFSSCYRSTAGSFRPFVGVRLRTLTLAEREDISRGIASGSSIREIARGLQRAGSTVSREVARHGGRPLYRASEADRRAWESALRPKPCLLALHRKLGGSLPVNSSWIGRRNRFRGGCRDGIAATRACACPTRLFTAACSSKLEEY